MSPIVDRLSYLTGFSSLLSKKLANIDPAVLSRASVILALYERNTPQAPATKENDVSFSSSDKIDLLKENNLCIWFNVRAAHLNHHPGEVCFPGGKREPQDASDIAAGLRESQEEFGLAPDAFKLLTVLNPSLSRSLSIVQPVVGLLPADFEPVLAPDEVAAAFSVPLTAFTSTKYYSFYDIWLNRPWGKYKYRVHSFWIPYSICDRIINQPASVAQSLSQQDRLLSSQDNSRTHEGFLVWGLTAQFIAQLVHLLYPGMMPFPLQSPDSQLTFTEIAEKYIDWSLSKKSRNSKL